MAGKGSEIGYTLEQIAELLDHLKHPEHYRVCLDTCHMNDAGYDMQDFDAVLDQFDSLIGLKRLCVIHLNDSKNPRGARKDRHANIGMGTIGFEALHAIAENTRTAHVPKILETPYIGKHAPYGIEISMLRKGVFEAERLNELNDRV